MEEWLYKGMSHQTREQQGGTIRQAVWFGRTMLYLCLWIPPRCTQLMMKTKTLSWCVHICAMHAHGPSTQKQEGQDRAASASPPPLTAPEYHERKR